MRHRASCLLVKCCTAWVTPSGHDFYNYIFYFYVVKYSSIFSSSPSMVNFFYVNILNKSKELGNIRSWQDESLGLPAV
jgi:hypothetical protein